ncbi:MAG: response regulator [Anaerolineae bacterium]|nr:response regulator [Anaerolineae bacterium]
MMSASENVKPSVLVTDDDRDNRELFKLVMTKAGYEVVEAVNGEEALTILDKRSFTLLILDLQMPHVNGTTVLKTVRANPKFDRMKIIVATANAHMTLVEVDDLADYVIQKPVDFIEFIHLAERLRVLPYPLGVQKIYP